MKLKMIFDPPPDASYGTRPETHFVKISHQCWRAIREFSESEGITLETAIHHLLAAGLEAVQLDKGAAPSERTVNVLKIAKEVLGDEEKAKHWISSPNQALGGNAPISALKTDEGIDQVVAILRRIEYGVFS